MTALLRRLLVLGSILWLGQPSVQLDPAPSRAERVSATVVGLGDSVPAAARCTCVSYVGLLAQHTGGRLSNLARNGETSAGLLEQVRQSGTRATAHQITVITIGANDFDSAVLSRPGCTTSAAMACYGPTLLQLEVNLTELLSMLVPAYGPQGSVLVTGYWNVFLDGDVGAARGPAYVRDSDDLTRSVNAAIAKATEAAGMTYVDVYTAFKQYHHGNDTELLAPDGDHPSAAGHRLIDRLLEQALAARQDAR